MPSPSDAMNWTGAVAWFGVIALCAFLVTWVVTDLLRIRRTPYIGVLAAVTGSLTYGYLAWSGTDAVGFVRNHWVWGLVGAVVTFGFNLGLIRLMVRRGTLHAPSGSRLHGWKRAFQVLWEDVVYGAAEGMLLSVLPLLALWQAGDQLGWTTGWGGKVGTGALAFAGSLFVIGVHHLGYREYRGSRMKEPYIGCFGFSLAYLITGSPLAAMLGHMGTHDAMLLHGFVLPPHQEEKVLTLPEPKVQSKAA
jgi:hypothetical protein